MTPDITISMLVAGEKDVVLDRLLASLRKLVKEIEPVESRLANEAMLAKAPPEVVEDLRTRKIDLDQRILVLVHAISDL